MNFYKDRVLPRIVDQVCQAKPMARQRKKLIHRASGDVLEVGIGTGLNLPFYDTRKVISITGIDPSPGMAEMAKVRAQATGIDFRLLTTGAETIPLPTSSVDSAVMTYTLCTIPDSRSAIQEIYRVLKQGGILYFCEHGLAPDHKIRQLQNWLTPIWKIIAGGCHLNRGIEAMVKNGGFHIQELEKVYLPGWRPASFNYLGTAEKLI